MPNAAPITITDGTTTFYVVSPDSVTGTHVQYQDLTEANLNLRTLLHFDRPSNGQKQNRRTIRLNVPMERTDAGGATYIEQGTGRAEFIYPASASVSERKNIREALAYAILTAEAEAVVDNPEWVW